MEAVQFLQQHLVRGPAGDPVRAQVHHVAELGAGMLQVGETGVGIPQVRLGGHQVGLGDPHARLAAALGRRVSWDTCRHREPVVAPERHH
jgi:hypothetical protein